MASLRKSNRGKGDINTQSNQQTQNLDSYLTNMDKASKETTSTDIHVPTMAPAEKDDMRQLFEELLRKQTEEITTNIKAEIGALREKMDGILDSVEFNANCIETNKTELGMLKNAFKELQDEMEKKLTLQEIYMRKPNLLIYGVPDKEDAETACRSLFEEMGIEDAHTMDFVNIHRLPRFETTYSSPNKPKTVIIKFVLMKDRQRILDASFRTGTLLRGSTGASKEKKDKTGKQGIPHAKDSPLPDED